MKTAMFVIPRSSKGSRAATTNNRSFFVANFSYFQDNRNSGVLAFVIGNQSGWPLPVLGRNAKSTAFSILTYQRGKEYISFNAFNPKTKCTN